MNDPRAYATALAENSLGLVEGSLGPEALPEGLVAAVTAAVRGQAVQDDGAPILEKQMLSLLATVRESSFERRGGPQPHRSPSA
jgi:hypothetical protein